MKRIIGSIFMLLLMCLPLSLPAQQVIERSNTLRDKINVNTEWSYYEDLHGDAELVNLPHTWNAFDGLSPEPGYRRDTSHYVKKFDLSNIQKGDDRYIFYFEGSNITTQLYVNGDFVGMHVGGYIGFCFDITDHLNFGELNEVMVTVDNSYNIDIIPSQKSDFFIYGGIIRDVWFEIRPATYIERAWITTPEVSAEIASLSMDIKMFNHAGAVRIDAQLLDADYQLVHKVSSSEIEEKVQIDFPEVENPRLWSPDDPYRYRMLVQLYDDRGILIDEVQERLGFRWFEFKEHGPFYLNGKRLKIRGTHRHEEHAGYGGALPNEIHWQDMQKIKDMGANFVRLAHYPQDPQVYEACDSLGLLVWDEVPWCRGGMGGETWKQNTMYQLKSMIKQNYNHPSIIIWSMGNEIYWLSDFEGGDDKDSIDVFMKEMIEVTKQLDPYRLTGMRKYSGNTDLFDVFSPSIWSGWYGGVYKKYEDAVKKMMERFPYFVHMEYGGSSLVGRHTENPITGDGFVKADDFEENENFLSVRNISNEGDMSESYIVDLFDWYLSVIEGVDDFSGAAQWSIKDFGTPVRPKKPIPYMNQKGLLDRMGQPKDAYFVFKSYWTTDPEFVYIEAPKRDKRYAPDGKKLEFCVYSNCYAGELFVNGKSQGKKIRTYGKFPAHGLQWFTLLELGENKIVAVGYNKDGEVVDRDTSKVSYTNEANKNPFYINLSYETIENGNILVTAIVTDWDGRRCLDFNGDVFFSKLSGKGKLYQNYGSPTRSAVNQFANGKASIEYRPVSGDKAVIGVMGAGTKGEFIEIYTK
jgi:beta-galactosidase